MSCFNKLTFYLFIFFCLLQTTGYSQRDFTWFKGWWLYYRLTPDSAGGKKIESDLEITNISDTSFSGFQKLWCVEDTLWQMKKACNGYFSHKEITWHSGDEWYRKEPPDTMIWDAFAKGLIDTAYFSIRDHKLILHIQVQPSEKNGVTEFAYYRDLSLIDFSIRYELMKRYGTPQLIDDVPVTSSGDTDTSSGSYTDVSYPPGSDVPQVFVSRKNKLVKTVNVTSPNIQVVLLDDAEIDGDIISLYHNKELVLDHKTLGRELAKYKFTADAAHPHHEFTIIAENLGSIPPNTALVRIRAGEKKYEFVVHANLHENIKLAIEYTPQK